MGLSLFPVGLGTEGGTGQIFSHEEELVINGAHDLPSG